MKYGNSQPYGKPWCKCPLLPEKDHIINIRTGLQTSRGDCKTKIFIYCAPCKLCKNI